MISWSRLAMARSGPCISAIFASRSPSPSAFFLFARFGLQLFGALLHRGSFLVRESLGLLRGLLCAHRFLLCRLSHVRLIWACGPSLKDTRGRRLRHVLLRCLAPFLCSRDAIEGHGF